MNRNNILKSSILVFTLGLTTACGDLLDLEPPMTQVTENFYRDQKDAFQALTSAYNILNWSAPSTASGSPQNCAFEVVSEILGDACYAGGANANDIPTTGRINTFEMRVNDPAPEALWNKYFTGIYRSNQLLVKIDGIKFAEEDLRARYKAEALFLRANYYFDLVRLFGNVPLILTPITPADYAQVQMAPEIIYKQIADDLLAAIQAKDSEGNYSLPASSLQLAAADKGRVTRAAAQSLLARVWLYYTGYYQQNELLGVSARDIVGQIEDVIENSGHSLMPNAYDREATLTGKTSPLFDVANKNNVEGVFEIQYTDLSKWGSWSNRQGCLGNQAVVLWGMRDVSGLYASGWSFAPVSKRLFDRFDSSDPRRLATFINAEAAVGDNDGEGLNYTKGYQNTGYFNRKFTPLTANNARYGGTRELNYRNNYPMIRFADVLLMGAELELLYGDKAKALDYYKRVRERAMGAGSVNISQNQLTLDMIDNERIFELSLEGHRYWDILRRGQEYADRTLTNGESNEFSVTYNKARAGLMPIPQYDISQSKGSLKQNPGY
ncbi:RagB/SusD family nutrient uptake outer membrane protein [uncultured Bacteroides sp.]|uniref:RagB/SusD family nutrient uptake outer membrane protein n=1 Tax=uncultured Bacteroides sp. TaxID=162156 RepID=UPI0025E37620|nr:RagB/SusD family nutrient uptake outer membrane protein [uncultured Bacteroides sp.]